MWWALDHEIETGEKVGRKFHLGKAAEMRLELQNLELDVLRGYVAMSESDKALLAFYADSLDEVLQRVDRKSLLSSSLSSKQAKDLKNALKAGPSKLSRMPLQTAPPVGGMRGGRMPGEPGRLPGMGFGLGSGSNVGPEAFLMMLLMANSPCAFTKCGIGPEDVA